MFLKVAAFEFRFQLRQPAFWVIAILFGLIGFGLVAAGENISLGGGGNVRINSPYTVALTNAAMALFFMLATTAIVANVVARDLATGFGPLIQATRLSKFDYLFGRFLGAFGVVAIAFAAVSLGMLIGTVMPWVDRELVGPFRPGDYLYGYLIAGLPAVFMTSALFFTLSAVTRSMMATYVGVVGLFIVYTTLTGALDRPEFEAVLAWADPFGGYAFEQVTRYWTPAERNTQLPPLEGVWLWNRVLWTAVSVGVLALAYPLYRPSPRGATERKQARLRALTDASEARAPASRPLAPATHGAASAWTQLSRRTGFEMGLIFKSVAYWVLLVMGAFLAVTILLFSGEVFGTPTLPLTFTTIQLLGPAFGIVSMIVAIFYSGEMIWRDRDRKTHEIVDSTPAPDWTFLLPKVLALTLVLGSLPLVGILVGMGVQTYKGVHDYQIGQYLWWYLLPQTVAYGLIAILALVVQSLSPNKFVGWAVMVVFLISTLVMGNLGFDHVLYNYGRTPAVPLSDMNGTGDFGVFSAWVRAYWTAFAALLLVLAYGLWRRGTETRFRPRLRRLPRRLAGPAGAIGAVALIAFVGLGTFVFINTNVWNDYETKSQRERRLADYERTLLGYEDLPQPSIAQVVLDLDLHPDAPRLVTRGTYVLENRTDRPLDQVHLRLHDDDLELRRLDVEGARLERDWPRFDYRIYRFAQPMAPGERRTVTFETVLAQRGFKNSGNTTRIVSNGTFVNNAEFAPAIGMDRQGLLTDRTVRRRMGLAPELRMRRLEDPAGRLRNYIGADWVTADITVTTVEDQTPLAPGYKVSDVVRDGRRTARFVTDAPILHFFSVQSARYAVARQMHRGVELTVHHHPRHDMNVARMLASMRSSLDYFQTAFGPYQFRQARIIEFPAYAQFAQAFANTMPYSESLGFIADFRQGEDEAIDYVTYITAHEMAHQWWAHQVVGANVQGATALSETLAQYGALMVMERTYGPDQIRRFLKRELDTYLQARGMERRQELPLYRVENQGYIHYQKGGSVMYLLRDQIGEAAVNTALQGLIQRHAFRGAPYPRSVDLIAALRAETPPERQGLITDLFERITLYDVKVTETSARRLQNGRWDVAVTVEARKLYADGEGAETEAPLDETFDLGLFKARPGTGAFDRSDILAFERRPLRSGTQVFRFVTREKPAFAGVDPYNKWIDRNSEDNLRAVE